MSLTTASPVLVSLIESIRQAVRSGAGDAEVAERVAELLEPCLRSDGFLTETQREPDPDHYRQHVLHVEEDGSFSIVALVWLPGQETPVHDHVSWCVVGVHQGQEYETRYEVETDEQGLSLLVECGNSVNPPGSVAALTPPGDIHKVVNDGQDLAISLHIYGADIGKLGSSIRRRYDLPVRAA
jgi:predicted metal-dependent enzyme (double-stranded beta helix superfamily)